MDLLKAIAIFAVVFYHIGIQRFGYLGVDIFLVINGYLVVKSLMGSIEKGDRQNYILFLLRKMLTFWPLVLLAGLVCMLLGFFTMLPDDYENLAESVIASNVFANNILLAITTKNYWNVLNDYKPLLHTWYLGVLLQSYVVLPILPILFAKHKNCRKICGFGFAILTVVSFALYQFSAYSVAAKFYYIPFRFFELGMGAILACFDLKKLQGKFSFAAELLAFAVVLVLLCIPEIKVAAEMKLLLVCAATAGTVAFSDGNEAKLRKYSFLKYIAVFGQWTFSIYIWHQVTIAFARYAVVDPFTPFVVVCLALLILCAGILSRAYIELPLSRLAKNRPGKTFLICFVLFLISMAAAGMVYIRGGVVHDFPELDIMRSDTGRGIHAAYNERANQYNVEFEENENLNVLVIGDSYGRDFVNILCESDYKDNINISYIAVLDPWSEIEHSERLDDADYIFVAFAESEFVDAPEYLSEYSQRGIVYPIGNKSFGNNNGTIYNRRFTEDYYDSSVTLDAGYFEQNSSLSEKFGDHFIDMLAPIQNEDGTVRVFTDDHKFISQDAKHLTRAGAQYYARILDLSWLAD